MSRCIRLFRMRPAHFRRRIQCRRCNLKYHLSQTSKYTAHQTRLHRSLHMSLPSRRHRIPSRNRRRTSIHAQWPSSLAALTSSPHLATLLDTPRNTQARRMPSAQNATKHSRAKTTWSSIGERIRTAAVDLERAMAMSRRSRSPRRRQRRRTSSRQSHK